MRFIKPFVKYFLIISLSLFVLTVVLIQLPSVQNLIIQKIIVGFKEQFQASVRIKRVGITLTGKVFISGFAISDPKKKEIASFDKIFLRISPFKLFKRIILIRNLELTNARFALVFDTVGHSNIEFLFSKADTVPNIVDKSATKPWAFRINRAEMENCKFLLDNKADSMKLSVTEKNLKVNFPDADILHLNFIIKSLTLKSVHVEIITYNRLAFKDTSAIKDSQTELKIALQRASFQDVRLHLYDSASHSGGNYYMGKGSLTKGTIDLAKESISFENIIAQHSSVYLNTGDVVQDTTIITSQSFATPSKWSISAKRAKVGLDALTLILPDNEQIKFLSRMDLKQVEMDVSGNFRVPAIWDGTIHSFSFTDLRTSQMFYVSGKSKFDHNFLQVSDGLLSFSNSMVQGDFSMDLNHKSIENIPGINIKIKISRLVYNDLSRYLPSAIDSMHLSWPGACMIDGEVKGINGLVDGRIHIQHRAGNVFVDGKVSSDSVFQIKLRLHQINLSQILSDSTMGIVSGNIIANGRGFELAKMQAKVIATFDSLGWNHHIYQNINSEYSLSDRNFAGVTAVNDSLLRLKLHANGIISGGMPDIYFDAHVIKADLKRMHLVNDTLLLQSSFHGRIKWMPDRSLTAYMDTLNIAFFTPLKTIRTSGKILYRQSNDSTGIYLQSNLGEISLYGNVPLAEIIAITGKSLNPFNTVPLPRKVNHGRSFRFSAIFKDFSLFQDIYLLDIRIPEPGFLKGEYSEQEDKMTINGAFARFELSGLAFDSASLDFNSHAGKVSANISVNRIETKIENFYNVNVNAGIANKNGSARIRFTDRKKQPWFDFSVASHFGTDSVQMNLKDSARLGYSFWTINPRNSITMLKNNLFSVKNFSAASQDKIFNVSGDNHLFHVSFSNFDMRGFAGYYLRDSSQIAGRLKGEASISNLLTVQKLKLKASLFISGLNTYSYALGDFSFTANNEQDPNIFEISSKLTHTTDQLSITGTYNILLDHPLDFDIRLNNFNIAVMSPLMAGYISKPTGSLNASVKIKGSTTLPDISGNFDFVNVRFNVVTSDLNYSITGQTINFSGSQAIFKGFKIQDQNTKTMNIDGFVKWLNINQFVYDLKLTEDKFLIYQSKKDVQYRKQNLVIVSGDNRVTGKNTDTEIRSNIRIDEGSSFFYKPSRNLSSGYENDMVVFSTKEDAKNNEAEINLLKYRFNLIANLELAPNSPVLIVVDPLKGDRLNIEAGGRFTLYIRPNQSPMLTGTAEINKGEYYLSLTNFIRKFEISPNSSILWKGDIANPEANIKASYSVRTSPQPLFTTTTETSSLGTLPFLVNLSIKNSISAPLLGFSISLPKEYENVDNGQVSVELQRINNDESEVNKQAATLLLFGTFFSSDMFNSGNYQFTNKQSTNALISQALNQFASQKVKFVNLNFNLASFNNYGESTDQAVHTELQVNASKNLFNNRLNTKLGVQMVLQGDEREQLKDPVNNLSPEFNIEYLLNRNRTISFEIFRNSEYTGLIDSKVTNMGAGISIKKDFDNLRDLFLSQRKKEKSLKPKKK